MSVAEQIRAIAGLRRAEAAAAVEATPTAPVDEADDAETPAQLARLEAESGIPVVAFAAIAEIVSLLLSEEDMP